MATKNKPPRWAQWLLQKFAHPDTLEEVEGDLEEFFLHWSKEHGPQKTKWKYIQTVFTLLRPFSRRKHHRNTNHSITMHFLIGSYFKMSWRTILKNRVSSLINISGLSIGLATGILILLVVMNELNYDRFHANLPDLYLLMKNQTTNDGVSTGWSTPGPMAEALRTDFPEVKYISRFIPFHEQRITVNDKVTYESGVYADADLFRMLTFQVLSGDPVSALEGNAAVVLTRDMAKKLFGDEDPVGRTILFNKYHALTVGAVVEDVPEASTIDFKMVMPFGIFEKESAWLSKWDDNRIMTWMQLRPTADIMLFNKKTTEMLQQRSDDKSVSLFAYPLKELHLYGHFSNGHPNGGRITFVQILIGFGAFMLIIACINFMNIATAQSEHRAKEVGIRKVMGATRKWIVLQFLNESFTVTFLSLLVAIALVVWILPGFNTLTHLHLNFGFGSLPLWFLILGIGLTTALLAGSYPSVFLSRFMPARVLKGFTSGSRGKLRKTLVTVQFTISVFFLIGTIILYAQFEHVRNRPLGYEQENLIDVRLDSMLSAKFAYLKTEALKIPTVVSATGGSDNILYSSGSVTGMDWPGKQPGEDLAIAVADVEYDWCKTIGVPIVQGRDFDPAFTSDVGACIINEAAAEKMHLENPVGSVVGGHAVVGVFKDFVFNNPLGDIGPMAVYLNPQRMNHLYLRVQNDAEWQSTIHKIETITKEISADFPFSFSFTKEEYQNHFNEFEDANLMVSIFAGMTIFISCLGLFGLSGFIAEKRSKEMSIRKVFGAGISKVLVALAGDFLKPVAYSLLLVIPLTVVVAQWALSNISYRVPLSWWMFALGAVMILVISITIVLYHGWRTARENPVMRLRNE